LPSIIKSFDSYKIYHFAGRRPLEGRITAAWIPCFNQGRQIGSLSFMTDESDVQENDYGNGQIKLFYHLDRFNEVVTTLRYEAPLSLMVDTETLEGALITRELEPVGEEESGHD
jgi:hypothetical protein